MIFGDYSRTRTVSFSIAGAEIEIVKSFTYLGVLFIKKMVDLSSMLNIDLPLPAKRCIC